MPFQSFMAASRKPNMKRFKLFPLDADLTWVDSANLGSPNSFVHPTTITGDMDGVNATFVLTGVSDTPAETWVIWNGLKMMEDVAYTISGGTITMLAGYLPNSGDTFEVRTWD